MKKPVTIQSGKRERRKWQATMASLAVLIFLTALAVCGTCVQAYASGETDDNVVINWIDASNLPRNNLIYYIFRHIGWAVICGMRFLVNGFQNVVFTVAENMGNLFYGSDPTDASEWGNGIFSSQIQNLVFVFMALIALAVLAVGILYIVKPQKVGTVAKNVVIGLIVAVSLPTLVGGAFALTWQLTQMIPGAEEKIGNQIIMNGTYDMLKLDDANLLNQLQRGTEDTDSTLDQWKANPAEAPIDLRPSIGAYGSDYELTHIDPTEMVGLRGIFDNDVTEEDKFWNNTVVKNSDGEETLQALNDGRIGNDGTSGNILSGQYYRWNFNWMGILIPLFVMTVVLGLCGIKLVRLLFEMLVKQLLAQILAFIDLHTMQRLKQCLYSILSSCAAFFGTFLMLQLYILAQSAIGTWTSGLHSGWSVLGQVIIQIALGWAVIDGPDIFEKLFGMDIGTKSAIGTLYGLQTIGRAAKAGFQGLFGTRMADGTRVGGLFGRKGAFDTAVSATSRAASGVAGAAGFLKGIADGSKQSATRQQPASAQTPSVQAPSSARTAPGTAGNHAAAAPSVGAAVPASAQNKSGKEAAAGGSGVFPRTAGAGAARPAASVHSESQQGPVPSAGFEGAIEGDADTTARASAVSDGLQKTIQRQQLQRQVEANLAKASQALASHGISAPPLQNPQQRGFAGAAHAAAQSAMQRGGTSMHLAPPMAGSAARMQLASGAAGSSVGAAGAIPSSSDAGMDMQMPDGGTAPMSDGASGGDSGWEQDEYADPQWQAVYSQRGYGETAGEYLHRRINAYAQKDNNRFTRPIRTAKRAYNLGRNTAVKHTLDRKTKQSK